jgi:hypothetical protein
MSTDDLKDGGGKGTAVANGERTVQPTFSTPSGRLSREEIEQSGSTEEKESKKQSIWRRAYTILTWTPPNCRWDPNQPPQFSMSSTYIC